MRLKFPGEDKKETWELTIQDEHIAIFSSEEEAMEAKESVLKVMRISYLMGWNEAVEESRYAIDECYEHSEYVKAIMALLKKEEKDE